MLWNTWRASKTRKVWETITAKRSLRRHDGLSQVGSWMGFWNRKKTIGTNQGHMNKVWVSVNKRKKSLCISSPNALAFGMDLSDSGLLWFTRLDFPSSISISTVASLLLPWPGSLWLFSRSLCWGHWPTQACPASWLVFSDSWTFQVTPEPPPFRQGFIPSYSPVSNFLNENNVLQAVYLPC